MTRNNGTVDERLRLDGHSPSVKRLKQNEKRLNQNQFLNLPDIALERIASMLSPRSTLKLMRVNKRFIKACKKRLYRKLIIIQDKDDRYLYKLAKAAKGTIITGKRIKGFFTLHKSLDAAERLEDLSYVNEFIYYREEKSKDQLLDDIVNECWDDVVNNMQNLKSFIAPKLNIKALDSSWDKSHITNLTIEILNSDNKDIGMFDLMLPNLKSLCLSFSEELMDDGTIPNTLLVIIRALRSKEFQENKTLETLEINADFGLQDLNTERHLRDSVKCSTNYPGLFSSYVMGSKSTNNHSRPTYPTPSFSSCVEERNYHENLRRDLNSRDPELEVLIFGKELSARESNFEEPQIHELDKNHPLERIVLEENDRLYQRPPFRSGESDHDYSSYEEKLAEKDMALKLRSIDSFRPGYLKNGSILSFGPVFEIISELINILHREKIILSNVKTLKFSNMLMSAQTFYRADRVPYNVAFDSVFPNFYQIIETLSLNNLFEPNFIKFDKANKSYEFWGGEDAVELHPEAYERTESFLAGFIDSTRQFDNLKKLKFFCIPRKSQIYSPNAEVIFFTPEEEKKMFSYADLFGEFLNQCPQLEELEAVASVEVKLTDFYNIISKAPSKNKLKRLSFISPDMIPSYITKFSNLKVFKKFKHFSDVNNVTNYQNTINKIAAEHFIEAFKTENYEYSALSDYNNKDVEIRFFTNQYNYLFAEQVEEFFKLCPHLEKFKYFGFTFNRWSFK
ncbi:hypothetical protein BN7_3745 [Wickerhamomyces ciferrii]|uniref:F-box domain-containing protein n=1 Tax=Wickerhamomyces ciferrii (strain ATCC 14091 / BCRC 22168 / CBS 111 / JCM 3599 / NBRC 0793 / NRRL Y-1031 F-60-10) TaxID=1206466 RepID=K0KMI8_WICCF|nr:uncharacterized protein BN7_3745 [Wickerhamomyces ciferrii]CCH44186.1 hypothetical protein BN7_3745 [Wickerhamomyces ciferrii]